MESLDGIVHKNIQSESRVNTKEQQRNFVHDFFSLSKEQEQIFRKDILESKGIIRIVIHPYYVKYTNPYDIYSDKKFEHDSRITIVEKGFEKILKAKKSAPILLFEGYDNVDDTLRKIVPILKNYDNKIYLVPTYQDSPDPFTGNETRIETWAKLIKTLKDLGVKKCVVGGIHFSLNSPEGGKSGCVGATIERLKNDFELQISSLNHPSSRKDVEKPDSKP
ncbi:MAG: hypothetical protein WCS86_00030 [Candidatus Paceibacterota bacterium]